MTVSHFQQTQWVSLCLLCVACANPLSKLPFQRSFLLSQSTINLHWQEPSPLELEHLEALLKEANTAVERWGRLPQPVTLSIVPSHEALETAVGVRGYSWLRAWSYAKQIILQAPGSWRASGASDAELVEILTHELTHCYTFQKLLPATTDAIPTWFREGLATVTAQQGARYLSLEELADWQQANASVDVFRDAERLSKDNFDTVYSFSHHAMVHVLRQHGDASIEVLLGQVSAGEPFQFAFEKTFKTSLTGFQATFRSYLLLRQFRGDGRPYVPADSPR